MAKLADGYPKPRLTPEQLADMLDNATRYTMQRSILIDLDTARFISDALRDLAVRVSIRDFARRAIRSLKDQTP